MSTSEMPSGRGRLPGMGPANASASSRAGHEALVQATPAGSAEENPTPSATSPTRLRGPRTPAVAAASTAARTETCTPLASEPKIQVNPRIYQGTWGHYEELADQLPRHQRRGALTALVNSILAQHAPLTVDEARRAIDWLRHTENRDD